ncbi:hypothetical protein [Pseudonocardia sp. D17]
MGDLLIQRRNRCASLGELIQRGKLALQRSALLLKERLAGQ